MTARPARILLLPGILALAAGIWAGLTRIGWTLPAPPPGDIAHGPLMVSGFLGTLIGVERAIGLRRTWAFGAPALTGVGAIALIARIPRPIPEVAVTAGAAVLAGVFLTLLVRHPTLGVGSMFVGALAWLVGNVAWTLGFSFTLAVSSWVAFLILTIAGERLELSRLISLGPGSRFAFAFATVVLLVGALRSATAPNLDLSNFGARVFGVGVGLMAAWLLAKDIAWRSVGAPGFPRFIALALLAGFCWLAFAGGFWLVGGRWATGPYATAGYDASLHAVFLGFVFSMVFAHAPMIFPSVLGIAVPFHRAFYVHLLVLHISLAIRVASDFGGWPDVRRWAGLLNAVAIVLFLAVTMGSAALARRGASQPS